MKIELVFKNSGDSLPIQIVYNNELVTFLLDKFQGIEFNYEHFSNVNAVLSSKQWCNQVDNKVKHIQNCVSKLNPVLEKLIATQFELRESIIECLLVFFKTAVDCGSLQEYLLHSCHSHC